jgi:phycobilisome rod-core linker protein
MSIPLLTYVPSSQNQRVESFEIPGDESPRIYSTGNSPSASDMDTLIFAAYRQIFNEQQMTSSSRQMRLESQLRAGQITVREFIHGLATSDVFRSRNYDTNNNYRFVQMCVQRVLGRDVYSDREKLAWSTILATKGLHGFIGDLINSDEYAEHFSDNTVPYQRRRILSQRLLGELPFARMARYDEFYKANLPKQSGLGRFTGPGAANLTYYRWDWQKTPPKAAVQAGKGLIWAGTGFIALLLLLTAFGF